MMAVLGRSYCLDLHSSWRLYWLMRVLREGRACLGAVLVPSRNLSSKTFMPVRYSCEVMVEARLVTECAVVNCPSLCWKYLFLWREYICTWLVPSNLLWHVYWWSVIFWSCVLICCWCFQDWHRTWDRSDRAWICCPRRLFFLGGWNWNWWCGRMRSCVWGGGRIWRIGSWRGNKFIALWTIQKNNNHFLLRRMEVILSCILSILCTFWLNLSSTIWLLPSLALGVISE